jgi:hypothetical protein
MFVYKIHTNVAGGLFPPKEVAIPSWENIHHYIATNSLFHCAGPPSIEEGPPSYTAQGS